MQAESQSVENTPKIIFPEGIDKPSATLYSLIPMANVAKMIAEQTCKRCGYKWYPRTPAKPRNCANKSCNSPYWDRPRRKEKVA